MDTLEWITAKRLFVGAALRHVAATLLVLAAIGLAAFLVGYWFFRRSKNAFVDVL